MLILTRRTGESVLIGDVGQPDPITLTVLGVKGNQVRIGITAPKHVTVHRQEIFERIKRELAAGPGAPPEDDAKEVNGNH